MVRAQIRVTPPDGRWKSDIPHEFPEMVVCLPSMVTHGEKAIEVVNVSETNPETVLHALEEHSEVVDCRVMYHDTNYATAQLQTTDPILLVAANESGTPLTYPIELTAGEIVVEVISTHKRISALRDSLDTAGVTFEVMSVQQDHEICRVLTERQREVVLAAVDHGYYETPRKCSLTELADEIGIAKSTCSGTLQRAEEALVEYFFANRLPVPQDDNREFDAPKHETATYRL